MKTQKSEVTSQGGLSRNGLHGSMHRAFAASREWLEAPDLKCLLESSPVCFVPMVWWGIGTVKSSVFSACVFPVADATSLQLHGSDSNVADVQLLCPRLSCSSIAVLRLWRRSPWEAVIRTVSGSPARIILWLATKQPREETARFLFKISVGCENHTA